MRRIDWLYYTLVLVVAPNPSTLAHHSRERRKGRALTAAATQLGGTRDQRISQLVEELPDAMASMAGTKTNLNLSLRSEESERIHLARTPKLLSVTTDASRQ